jgi:hypothetical protein
MHLRHWLALTTVAGSLLAPAAATASHSAAGPTCDGRRATIVGTARADHLVGTASADVIAGLAGNDVIDGRGGADVICGGAGDDQLFGGGGDELLLGGPGADQIEGGPGVDTADYAAVTGPVRVDLSQTPGVASGGGDADRLADVEDVRGSGYGDTLVGSRAANRLQGGRGDDTLIGGAGDDVLLGDAGDDFLAGQAGHNRLDGGIGADLCSQASGAGTLAGCETAVARAATIPPGGALRSDVEAAALVRQRPWEPRPANRAANETTPDRPILWPARAEDLHWTRWIALRRRVTGRFAGSTDEIIQWASYKWGIDEDVTRAIAAQESDWDQAMVGDAGESFGLMQVKDHYRDGTLDLGGYPWTARSTALNVDITLAWVRACYEGAFYDGGDWLYGGSLIRGDIWGCVGAWYSGDWYGPGAKAYIADVKKILATRPWLDWR